MDDLMSIEDEDFRRELDNLLSQEAPSEPYQVTPADIRAEEELPLEILAQIDWMVDDG